MRKIVETFNFIYRQWPRPNQTHFSAKHVQQLRQFIQTEFSQDLTDLRNARIIGHLEYRPRHFIHCSQLMLKLLSIGNHRAELEYRKRLAVQPGASLSKQDWARRTNFDEYGDQREKPGEYREQNQSPDAIQQLLEDALP